VSSGWDRGIRSETAGEAYVLSPPPATDEAGDQRRAGRQVRAGEAESGQAATGQAEAKHKKNRPDGATRSATRHKMGIEAGGEAQTRRVSGAGHSGYGVAKGRHKAAICDGSLPREG